MSEEIKLWQIKEDDKFEVCNPSKLDLEERLENWIEENISILSPDLLIIGRQVETDFGGVIDLLCLNRNGDILIVELKRGKTPREVTAQALDYASWVSELSNDRITSIANNYLSNRGPIENAFSNIFKVDLPDILNENHGIIIVASQIDPSTERIIKYLSDTYGVNINAATFQYFKTQTNEEFLSRVFLVEPEQIEYQVRIKSSSKRRRNLTYEELQGIAVEKGIGELYCQFIDDLSQFFGKHTTRSSIAFTKNFEGGHKVVFSLIPQKSTGENGLHFQIYSQRFCQLFSVDEDNLLSILPKDRKSWTFDPNLSSEYSGFSGYFTCDDEIDTFIRGIRKALNP